MKNIYLIDISKDKSKQNQYLSNTLISKIQIALNENKKAILYLNKRWEYNLLVCLDCNNLEKCPRCDIALSIHKNPDKMVCHHCSFVKELNINCTICNWPNLNKVWVWTQQIEQAIKNIFKDKVVFRLDSDNVSNITEKKETLENIKKADIIIWTKMITTWFDFRNIWVIWVILIEQELQIPKYDTEEKIYSNIKQLIWRWWRLWSNTEIIIQSYIPNNSMIKDIIELNYKEYFIKTLKERKLFNYPPYSELVNIRYKNFDKNKTIQFLDEFYKKLLTIKNDLEIIKLETIYKRDNQYFWNIMIKWKDIKVFLWNFKKDIFENKDLVITFN